MFPHILHIISSKFKRSSSVPTELWPHAIGIKYGQTSESPLGLAKSLKNPAGMRKTKHEKKHHYRRKRITANSVGCAINYSNSYSSGAIIDSANTFHKINEAQCKKQANRRKQSATPSLM